MTTRKNTSRKTLLALGLVLVVLGLSLLGWRVGASEYHPRWGERLHLPATAPQADHLKAGARRSLARLSAPAATSPSALLASSLGTNIALGKPTTQSSNYFHSCNPVAAKAVDGNTDGDFYTNCSVSHTNYDPQAWWQVDLQADYFINTIDLWNRTDCCSGRLNNFDVLVSQDGISWSTFHYPGTAPTTTTFAINAVARYVKVQLRGTNWLQLAEVQVWGAPTCTPPAITAQPAGATKIVGQSVNFSVAATGTGLSYQWRKGGVAIGDATTSSYSISVATLADAGSYDVVVSSACGNVTSDAATLTVNCPDITVNPSTIPMAQLNAAYPAQTFSATGGNAPYTFSLTGALPAGMSFSGGAFSGTPTTPGAFPLTVTATDNYGCAASRNLTLKVNRPPVAACQNVTVTSDATCSAFADINNGSSDPDGDTLTITQAPAGPYAVGTHTVTLTVSDGRGGTNSCTATVTVNPSKPVPVITGPASGSLYQAGMPVPFTGTFTDLAGTTHTASWKFESATPPAITAAADTVVEPAGSEPGTVSKTQSFTTPGVYLVSLTVTNNCGGSDQATKIGVDEFSALVVIYDPSAGWVTGGGWINSPAGAYTADPLLTGKANFGFVSKYQNGASVPTGNTEFHFKAGNLKFNSTAYEWMVIAGARAQYKGSGKINGAGDYRFMLTALDGQQPGGGGQDKFRLRIWNNAGGGLVYDNQLNAPDSADPTTLLGGGQIVIHK